MLWTAFLYQVFIICICWQVIANATDSTAQKTGKEAEETMAYAVQDHATQEQLDDTQHDMNCSIATSAKTATPPNSHFEALPLSGRLATLLMQIV